MDCQLTYVTGNMLPCGVGGCLRQAVLYYHIAGGTPEIVDPMFAEESYAMARKWAGLEEMLRGSRQRDYDTCRNSLTQQMIEHFSPFARRSRSAPTVDDYIERAREAGYAIGDAVAQGRADIRRYMMASTVLQATAAVLAMQGAGDYAYACRVDAGGLAKAEGTRQRYLSMFRDLIPENVSLIQWTLMDANSDDGKRLLHC